jgi:uncharacterized protein YrrD
MHYQSARHFLGLPVLAQTNDSADDHTVGLIESVTLNPRLMIVDGFLVGKTGKSKAQSFLNRECILEAVGDHLVVSDHQTKQPPTSNRVLGLQAWTTQPKFLVGFVYDFYFCLDDGSIESFVVHQLIRTWRIPAPSVEKITPKALLINNDTTIKLKLTPYQPMN